MIRLVTVGVFKGSRIRLVRKPGRCEYDLGGGKRCPNQLKTGDSYFEGDPDPFKAGGFAATRFCMSHVEEVGV